MSQEFQIEVRFKPDAEQIGPEELALVSAMLPELLLLLQQTDASDED